MNSNEPFFLVDEELIELEAIVKDVQFRLKNPDLEKNQMLLNSFIKSCIRTQKKAKIIPIPIPSVMKPKIKEIPGITIKETRKIQKGKKIFPVPSPGRNKINGFKTIPKYKKEITETKLKKSQLPLIQDNYSNKLLAMADINDRYIIREPPIKENEIKILKQLIQQKPENPKQLWQLLKQTAPDLTEEQLTNIKYYAVNSLFALGRIEPLLHDKEISGIKCDGIGKYIIIRRDGKLLKTNIIFKDKEDLDSYIKKLAQRFNKTLDENNPIVDTVDKDHRFHLILGLHGASSKFSIKKVE